MINNIKWCDSTLIWIYYCITGLHLGYPVTTNIQGGSVTYYSGMENFKSAKIIKLDAGISVENDKKFCLFLPCLLLYKIKWNWFEGNLKRILNVALLSFYGKETLIQKTFDPLFPWQISDRNKLLYAKLSQIYVWKRILCLGIEQISFKNPFNGFVVDSKCL